MRRKTIIILKINKIIKDKKIINKTFLILYQGPINKTKKLKIYLISNCKV